MDLSCAICGRPAQDIDYILPVYKNPFCSHGAISLQSKNIGQQRVLLCDEHVEMIANAINVMVVPV